MVRSEESACLGQSLVAIITTQMWPVVLCVYAHATELVDVKGSPEASDTLLLEDDWSVVVTLYGNVTSQEEGREDNEAHPCQKKIKQSLDLLLKSVHTIINIRKVSLHPVSFSYTYIINNAAIRLLLSSEEN